VGSLAVANVEQATGRWYFEVKLVTAGPGDSPFGRRIGVAPSFFDPLSGPDIDPLVCSLNANGQVGCGFEFANWTTYQPAKAGDVIGVALDLDQREYFVHRNGSWLGPDPATDKGRSLGQLSLPLHMVPWVGLESGDEVRANFGQAPLAYKVPGFKTGWYSIGK